MIVCAIIPWMNNEGGGEKEESRERSDSLYRILDEALARDFEEKAKEGKPYTYGEMIMAITKLYMKVLTLYIRDVVVMNLDSCNCVKKESECCYA